MEKFVDRTEDLQTLETAYKMPKSSLIILYGRRRVGKTSLITEFIKDKKALYYLATEESETLNRNAFREKAADFLGHDLLREAVSASWETIFKIISNADVGSKIILVIDEFQYLGKVNPAFPSVMQRIWDEILKEKNVMLILAGSLISMMVSQTLSYGSPLYGRRTFQILLKQVQFRYYREFYDSLTTRRELIERYAVTGGVPKYIESFVENPCQDIYDSIEQHILNPSSYLYTEPYFLLQQEVTEIGSYFSLLRAIAAGNSKLSAIASALSVKSTGLTKYLKTLIDLDILEREVPVTEDNPEKSKKGLYRIKDNYLRFWFAFVYPNMSLLESGNRAIVLEKIRHGMHRGHTSFVYENVCQEKMWDLNTAGAWDFHFSKLGRYWDNSTEIDITALDPDGHNLILGECKFWNEPIGPGILRALEKKAPSVSWNRDDRKVHYILFSISGFTDELQAIAKEREDVLLCE